MTSKKIFNDYECSCCRKIVKRDSERLSFLHVCQNSWVVQKMNKKS